MNNFLSASAIVAALMSPKVAMLFLACESQAIQIIQALNSDLAPTSGGTLRQAETNELIPWLGIVGPQRMSCYYLTPTFADPHLSTLDSTFAHSDPIVEVDGHYLVNFKLCSELAEQIDSVAGYSPPPVSSKIRQDVLEYVEYNLHSSLTTKASCAAVVRSARPAGKERSVLTKREMKKSLGESWAPPQGKMNARRREGQMVQKRGDVGRPRGGMVRWQEDMTRRREETTARQREERPETIRQREEDMERWHKDMARWRKDMARWRKDTTRWRKDNSRRDEEDLERPPEEDMIMEPRRKGLLAKFFGSKTAKK
jgi:hypothetical protein